MKIIEFKAANTMLDSELYLLHDKVTTLETEIEQHVKQLQQKDAEISVLQSKRQSLENLLNDAVAKEKELAERLIEVSKYGKERDTSATNQLDA